MTWEAQGGRSKGSISIFDSLLFCRYSNENLQVWSPNLQQKPLCPPAILSLHVSFSSLSHSFTHSLSPCFTERSSFSSSSSSSSHPLSHSVDQLRKGKVLVWNLRITCTLRKQREHAHRLYSLQGKMMLRWTIDWTSISVKLAVHWRIWILKAKQKLSSQSACMMCDLLMFETSALEIWSHGMIRMVWAEVEYLEVIFYLALL